MRPPPRPATQPVGPGLPALETAFRERVLKRAVDLLATNPPLTGREIAQRLNQLDARIDRHLINSILTHEGGPYVVHDAQTGRYRLKRDELGSYSGGPGEAGAHGRPQ